MATYQSIRYNVDYAGKAGSLMPLLLFTSDGSDATASFASGIDSTYKEYLFIYNNIHPETDGQFFTVNLRDGSTAYDASKTTTHFTAEHDEADSATGFEYKTGSDLANGTGIQRITDNVGNGNDECCSGLFRLYSPSSTTFVKHFMGVSNTYQNSDYSVNAFVGGYANTTSAIDGVQFKFASGEIQGGTIGMFGVI